MSRLRYRTKIDLGVAAVTILVGAFFTYQVSLVESIAEDAIGPRMIPYFLSIAMMFLGFIIGVRLRSKSGSTSVKSENREFEATLASLQYVKVAKTETNEADSSGSKQTPR